MPSLLLVRLCFSLDALESGVCECQKGDGIAISSWPVTDRGSQKLRRKKRQLNSCGAWRLDKVRCDWLVRFL